MSGKGKKTATDNQWAGQAAIGTVGDHKHKTEFSNEWASTNKVADATSNTKKKKH